MLVSRQYTPAGFANMQAFLLNGAQLLRPNPKIGQEKRDREQKQDRCVYFANSKVTSKYE